MFWNWNFNNNKRKQAVSNRSILIVIGWFCFSWWWSAPEKSWWWASLKISHLLRTHNREPGSIALASLSAVLVLCDAAVGGQSIFLLHLWDVQSSKWGQEETITWGEQKSWREGRFSSLNAKCNWLWCCILVLHHIYYSPSSSKSNSF